MKTLKEGQTVTLINWGNVIIKSIERLMVEAFICCC